MTTKDTVETTDHRTTKIKQQLYEYRCMNRERKTNTKDGGQADAHKEKRRENAEWENYSFESNFSEEIMKNVLGLFIIIVIIIIIISGRSVV